MFALHALTFFAGAVSLAAAQQGQTQPQAGYKGFNSGATLDDTTPKQQSDFAEEFRTAQGLHGSPGSFNSVRLYTNVQAETTDTPIAAFRAAMDTNTTMLLGLWCSGTDSIKNELTALSSAIDEYGQSFVDLVVGISVGSEDLYRASASGVRNDAGLGADADAIVGFIRQVREAIADTPLRDAPVGHVDTSSAFFNQSNAKVIEASDFIGMDAYPYYEDNKPNSFADARGLWDEAYRKTLAAADGTPVWITEIGWPSEGPDFGDAVASVENAKAYWQDLGCDLFGRTNTWWYNLRDSNPDNDEKFAITDDLSTTPLFDLSCPAQSDAPQPINLAGSTNSTGDTSAASAGSAPSLLLFSIGVVASLSLFSA